MMNNVKLKLKDAAWIYQQLCFEQCEIANQKEHIEKILPTQLRDDIDNGTAHDYYNGFSKNELPDIAVDTPETEVEFAIEARYVTRLLKRLIAQEILNADDINRVVNSQPKHEF